jgi:hypothetical protein
MKISKQEQIFIIIFIVAAIIGVGFFLLIMPGINNIDVSNKNLESTKAKYAELNKKLEHEATIDAEINAAYEEGKNLADSFYDDLTTYEADEIIRQFIAKGKDIKIDGLAISPFATSTLSISVFRPSEVTYPLKDFANTVVEKEEDVIDAEDIKAMSPRERMMYLKSLTASILSLVPPVTVGSIEVSFTAKSDKLENLHELVDILNEGIYDENIKDKNGKPQRKATYMKNVEFEMPYQLDAADKNTADNNQNAQGNNGNANNSDVELECSMNFTVSFYCIKPVENPNPDAAQAA